MKIVKNGLIKWMKQKLTGISMMRSYLKSQILELLNKKRPVELNKYLSKCLITLNHTKEQLLTCLLKRTTESRKKIIQRLIFTHLEWYNKLPTIEFNKDKSISQRGQFHFHYKQYKIPIGVNLSFGLLDIINGCLRKNQKKWFGINTVS